MHFEPAFVDSGGSSIFVLLRGPESAKQCVLCVPPFAEEMNKCRRQFTETARNLAEQGIAVLAVDLSGTGDSEGEFVEATWPQWKRDLETAILWAEERGLGVDSAVACRLGCALLAEALIDYDRSLTNTVFWQPVTKGRQFMTQFLRLRVAASLMNDDTDESVDSLRGKLGDGQPLEIAGYELSPTLWQSIERIAVDELLGRRLGQVRVLEVGGAADVSELSVVGQRLVNAAELAGLASSGLRVSGDPFWSSTEIVVNRAIIEHTVNLLVSVESQ